MDPLDPDNLPPPQRLALAYAPAAQRPAFAALFALDARMARIGAQASEPIIAQMKLAWWRDQFAKPSDAWPSGEPLLQELARLEMDSAHLSALVDGWEALIAAEMIDEQALQAFASGRAAGWLAVHETLGLKQELEPVIAAGRLWALADVAGALGGETVWNLAQSNHDTAIIASNRAVRPFKVLTALAKRATRRREPLLDGPAALGLAMRVGIFGR